MLDEGPMLETLDHTIRIGSTPTFLYFDLYLYSAYPYAGHYVYITNPAVWLAERLKLFQLAIYNFSITFP